MAPVRVERGDVVVLHRLGMAGAGGRFLKAARAVGAVVVYSTDDLIFTADFPHQIALLYPDDPVRYAQHRAAAADFRALLEVSDAALVSTRYLAESARCVVPEKRVVVIRNFLSAEQTALAADALRAAAPESGEESVVTLAYLSGSPTHDIDLGGIAAPLAETLRRCPGARLLLVGPVAPPPSLRPLAEAGRVLRHPFVPWRDLPELFIACRVDICLAPLDIARPFSHAKSEVKFLEAAAVRVPTVASPGAGFAEGVRDGEDCRVVRTEEEWRETLNELIRSREIRKRLGEAAQEAVAGRGTAAANAPSVRRIFREFEALKAGVPPASVSSVTVRPTLGERAFAAGRRLERRLMHVWLRGRRHLELLRAEAERGG